MLTDVSHVSTQADKRLGAPLLICSRFRVRFPNGLFLLAYTDEGLYLTADRERARVWRDKSRVDGIARLLGGEVREIHQQQNPPVRPTATQVECARILVEIAGGRFAGIWPAIEGRSEALVLWNSTTGTTQGCLVSELSAEIVRKKIQDSELRFEKGAA